MSPHSNSLLLVIFLTWHSFCSTLSFWYLSEPVGAKWPGTARSDYWVIILEFSIMKFKITYWQILTGLTEIFIFLLLFERRFMQLTDICKTSATSQWTLNCGHWTTCEENWPNLPSFWPLSAREELMKCKMQRTNEKHLIVWGAAKL